LKEKIMKKVLLAIAVALSITACIKEDDKTFRGTAVLEFDATVLNPVTAPFTHPVLLQIPRYTVPVVALTSNCSNSASVEPFIKRTSGLIKLRVNVVGPTQPSAREIDITPFGISAQLPSITFRQPSPCSNVTLTTADAVAGTHYSLVANKITVPADSSFGYLEINVLNAGATAGQTRVVGFELKETSTAKPSANYKKIAISIDQR
jgi:hypothetical protein